MSEVGVVETSSARRASVRRAAFAAAAGVLVVGLGFPAIVEAIATSQFDQLMTLSALAVGMAAGGFLLASVIGYAASRGARRAASRLRQQGHVRVHWVRMAPENVIVVLIVLPGWHRSLGELILHPVEAVQG